MKKLTIILIGLTLVSCGKRGTVTTYDRPEQPSQINYEKVWVNPKIIESDTLFTIIRAERVDSIMVDNMDGNINENGHVISFSFHINLASCKTNIYLTDSYNQEIALLYSSDLPTGYYRFNCDRRRINIEGYENKDLFIRISYCARSIIQKLEQ